MTASSDIRLFQNWGRIGTFLSGALTVLLGVAVARFVAEDGIRGRIWSITYFGENPPFVNDLPFLSSIVIGLVLLVFVFSMLAWVYRSGGVDRPILGLLAMSLFAHAIPMIHLFAIYPIIILLVIRGIRRREVPFPVTPLIFPLGLFLIVYSTSGLQVDQFFAFLATSVDHGMQMFLVILLPAVIRTRRQFEIFFHLLLLVASISVGVEFLQELLSFVLGIPVTFGTGPDITMKFPFAILPRVSGLMTNQNAQANVVGGIGLVALLWSLKPHLAISRSRRVMYFSVFLLMGIGVLLTTSRSGWLSFGIGVILVPFLRWPKKIPLFLLIFVALFTLGWSTGFIKAVIDEVMGLSSASAEFRWKIDHLAIQAWATSPWFGRGLFGVVDYFNPFQLKVHNAYLQILSSLGLFGVASFSLLAGMLTYRIRKRLRELTDPYDRDLIIGYVLVISLTAVQCLFTMFMWAPFLWSCIAILETLVMITARPRSEPEPTDLIFLAPQKHQHGT